MNWTALIGGWFVPNEHGRAHFWKAGSARCVCGHWDYSYGYLRGRVPTTDIQANGRCLSCSQIVGVGAEPIPPQRSLYWRAVWLYVQGAEMSAVSEAIRDWRMA